MSLSGRRGSFNLKYSFRETPGQTCRTFRKGLNLKSFFISITRSNKRKRATNQTAFARRKAKPGCGINPGPGRDNHLCLIVFFTSSSEHTMSNGPNAGPLTQTGSPDGGGGGIISFSWKTTRGGCC